MWWCLLSTKNELDHNRVEKLLLVFNIVLALKGISAGYTASYLSLYDPKTLTHYVNIFHIVPFCFLISLLLFAIPLFFKGKNLIKICDWAALGIIFVGIIFIFVY